MSGKGRLTCTSNETAPGSDAPPAFLGDADPLQHSACGRVHLFQVGLSSTAEFQGQEDEDGPSRRHTQQNAVAESLSFLQKT